MSLNLLLIALTNPNKNLYFQFRGCYTFFIKQNKGRLMKNLTELTNHKFNSNDLTKEATKYSLKQIQKSIQELMTEYKDGNWRINALREAEVKVKQSMGMKPQAIMKAFIQAEGSVVVDTLNRLFNVRTLEALVNSGKVVLEHKSRLRQDDMEMVYWTEAKLNTKSKALPENRTCSHINN